MRALVERDLPWPFFSLAFVFAKDLDPDDHQMLRYLWVSIIGTGAGGKGP